jgi:glutamate-1-semialdehyde 2,1-aminomutase
MGCVPPEPGFLEGLRALCDETETLLVFDEVMTGFRVHRGCAQARYGVTPDLTTLGKVVGGGFPLAAFGGREDIMRHLAPEGPVYQAGTLSGNPVAVAAGLATMQRLDDYVYDRLEAVGAHIENELEEAIAYHGCSMNRVGAMFTIFFREEAPKDFAEARTCDLDAFATFFNAALSGGVYMPASQFEAAFFSYTLEGADLEQVVDGLSGALVAAAG